MKLWRTGTWAKVLVAYTGLGFILQQVSIEAAILIGVLAVFLHEWDKRKEPAD